MNSLSPKMRTIRTATARTGGHRHRPDCPHGRFKSRRPNGSRAAQEDLGQNCAGSIHRRGRAQKTDRISQVDLRGNTADAQ